MATFNATESSLDVVSIVICTYNPEPARLQRVFQALHESICTANIHPQVILVDNNSIPPLQLEEYATFNMQICLLKEPRSGLAYARIAALSAIKSDAIICVDDDNLLSKNYIAVALNLISEYKNIGVFSAGQILPEYEATPPANIESYWPYMALLKKDSIAVSNDPLAGVLPTGAGMIVRREVMERFKEVIGTDGTGAITLGRDGQSLMGGEDTHIGILACDLGYSCGYFPELKIIHIMPEHRLRKNYLRKLVSDVAYSTALVEFKSGVRPIRLAGLALRGLYVVRSFITQRGPQKCANRWATHSRFLAAWSTFWSGS